MTLQISDFFSNPFFSFITLTSTAKAVCSAFELYVKYIFSSKWNL